MTKPITIRVLIADDHYMVRQGLAVFMNTFDDLELVGEAANGLEAIRLCADAHPNVVLMDLMMPEMDGIAATRAICQEYPNVRVVAMTSFSDQGLAQEALQAGAVGHVLKNATIDELAAAIRAAAGQPDLVPGIIENMIQAARRPVSPADDSH
ncbi:MAG: response regulator transcription factor [Chloroflexi bacterium]|nr:response regulator transcription factor [Chloroflexota bacterium]MBU1750552.1 response regulator transcription factor [Chloroflexota bacterium]MBU1878285.1 response regulator transcription factor [Chloroflexota bacterium]